MAMMTAAMRAGLRAGSALGRRRMATGYAESVSELIGTTPMVKLALGPPLKSLSDTTLYISLVIHHTKYTGWCQNDFNVHA
jgi:hypothetical protein